MTLKPGKPQKKNRPRRKKLGEEPLHLGDGLPDACMQGKIIPPKAESVFPDYRKVGATIQEATFAAEYLTNGFNAKLAAKRMNPKLTDGSAGVAGYDMLRNPRVQQLMQDYTSAFLRGKAYELEHRVLETLEVQAFYDIAKFVNPDGTLAFKKWDELPEALRRCVENVDVRFFGANAQQQSVSLQFTKRAEALKAIASYVAIMRNGLASQSPSGVSPEAELVLQAIFNGGRKLDRRLPSKAAGEKPAEAHPEAQVTLSGLG